MNDRVFLCTDADRHTGWLSKHSLQMYAVCPTVTILLSNALLGLGRAGTQGGYEEYQFRRAFHPHMDPFKHVGPSLEGERCRTYIFITSVMY